MLPKIPVNFLAVSQNMSESYDSDILFYLTHYVFTVFKKYTKYRIMLKIVKYDLKNA